MIGLVDGNNFFVSCERVFNRHLLGKRVAVLSNNDGCCVAMSPEFKALGIKRGTPYFQLRDREERDGLIFLSSNYELYGDISRRIISVLKEEAVEVEQYSIDEAFILPPRFDQKEGFAAESQALFDYGKRLRAKIFRWTGIPCGIGFAPTKTLAKIANHAAKKLPDGVLVLPEDPTEILRTLPVGEVWGVGRRLVKKLDFELIRTALDLREAPLDKIRSIGGVTLARTQMELKGVPCTEERDYEARPDSVSCSRSFGETVEDVEALSQSIASFIAQAATKLRKHRLFAAGCNIYAQTTDLAFEGRTVMFPKPTDSTVEMLQAVRSEIEALYRPGARYRKSGIVFFGLEAADGLKQGDLFEDFAAEKDGKAAAEKSPSELYRVIDELNSKLGKGSVFSAAEGIEKKWKIKRSMLSKRATTNWQELPGVK